MYGLDQKKVMGLCPKIEMMQDEWDGESIVFVSIEIALEDGICFSKLYTCHVHFKLWFA